MAPFLRRISCLYSTTRRYTLEKEVIIAMINFLTTFFSFCFTLSFRSWGNENKHLMDSFITVHLMDHFIELLLYFYLFKIIYEMDFHEDNGVKLIYYNKMFVLYNFSFSAYIDWYIYLPSIVMPSLHNNKKTRTYIYFFLFLCPIPQTGWVIWSKKTI